MPSVKQYVYFDVDDTLVMWRTSRGPEEDSKFLLFRDPYNRGKKISLVPHERHIQDLRDYSEAGWCVVVWSAGGYPWAREVVRTLGLRDYVDHILAKPDVYYDDIRCCDFMRNRRYTTDVPDGGGK